MDLLGDAGEAVMDALKLAGTFTALYLALLWAASVLWAYRDIRSRTLDPIMQIVGVALVALLPLLGVPIYLIVRPSETLTEAYERELEQEAIRSELHALAPCPSCRRPVERDFVVCAYCRTSVREECTRCRKLLSLDWRHCPYCGTSRPVRQEAPAPRPVAQNRYEEPEYAEPEGTVQTTTRRRRPPREEQQSEP